MDFKKAYDEFKRKRKGDFKKLKEEKTVKSLLDAYFNKREHKRRKDD